MANKGKPVVLLILLLCSHLFAQRSGERGSGGDAPGRGSITGRVFTAAEGAPVEYANIVLFSQRDSTQLGGTVSGKDGRFELGGLRRGRFFIEVHFIGYEKVVVRDIMLSRGAMQADAGKIELTARAIEGEGMEVLSERAAISYQIDKKVIDVSKQYTTASGTAVDVLENVPSVNVDIEGNVSLRGSGSFNVLIDGRPSVLDANDALQQIPASTIDNIEIITNPSARYDPDGVAGIINIVTKRDRVRGVSGVLNLNGGRYNRYGSDLLLHYKTPQVTLFVGADINNRNSPGSNTAENRTTIGDTVFTTRSDGNSSRGGRPYGFRSGLEFNLGRHDVLTFGSRFGQRISESSSTRDYIELRTPGELSENRYTSQDGGERGGRFYSLSMDYEHRFSGRNHKLAAQLTVSNREGEETNLNELIDLDGAISSGQISTEDGPSKRYRGKLDYIYPLGKTGKFEAGYQARADRSKDITSLSEFDPLLQDYVERSLFSNTTQYDRDIHSGYSLFAGSVGRLGFQGGLRAEYTDRLITSGDNSSFGIDRWDYFPSTHFSFKLPAGQQVMASYTRRIDRPRGWNLEPFLTWTDAFNVRQGNPALLPEYIDSYEMGYQTFFGKSLFSAEAYHRVTHNKIERVRSVYDEAVMLSTFANIGEDYSFGTEMLLNHDMKPWWNVNLMANLFHYRIEGRLFGENVAEEDFSWNSRFNNTFELLNSTRLQLNGIYNSPRVTAQGKSQGYFAVNAAVRHEFMNRSISATLQIRDMFATATREFTSSGTGFYFYSNSIRNAPMVLLNLSFNFNNYRAERQNRGTGGSQDGDFEGSDEF